MKTTSKWPTIWRERYSVSGFSKRCCRKFYDRNDSFQSHTSSTPQISLFRYYFNLPGPPPQLCQCTDDLGVGLTYFSTMCTYQWTSPSYLMCVGGWGRATKRLHKKHATWKCIMVFMIRACLNGSQLTGADMDTGVQVYCGRRSPTPTPLSNQA